MPASERSSRLDRYLAAYTDLTIKLDRSAFPSTHQQVHTGVPSYIPDGLVDMGRERTLNAASRDREQIVVDKHEIFTKYRPLLKEIFATDYTGMTLRQKKLDMAKRIGVRIWDTMTNDEKMAANGGTSPNPDLGGGAVRLSQLREGVCRHKALVFQVLAQAVGIKSTLVKGRLNGVRHATNMMRIDGQWYIIDVSNPMYSKHKPDGSPDYRPALYPIDGPPPTNQAKVYTVGRLKPNDTKYDVLSEMFWYIGRIRR